MQFQFLSKVLSVLFISFLFVSCGNDGPSEEDVQTSAQQTENTEGVIAQVGDQLITFNELTIMLNSSAMVGLSIPALGTPERHEVVITLLDKLISANLLYLDGLQKGSDRLTQYVSDMKKFEDAVLITMYRSNIMIGEIPVTADEVTAFYDNNIDKENELNDDLKLAIESKIRKQKYAKLKDSLRERIRADTEVKINEDVLSVDADVNRSDADIVATLGDKRVTWNDVKLTMRGADHHASLAEFYVDNDEQRLENLQAYIDNMLMADKARAAGIEKDEEFTKRTAEYRKTHLINVHRNTLVNGWKPTDDELKTYYLDHMDEIAIPESRKVQMVVVKTKEEAESIKADIDSGKITMFQAAQQYSLDPNAKVTLGEMGWVSQGTGFEGLDEFTFNLEPEVVSEPVESPAGWHLVKVLDVNDAVYQNFDEPQTRRLTLRLFMKNRFNDYVVELRNNKFDVAVYGEELTSQFQKEADFMAAMTKKANEKGSVTEQRMQDMQKWVTPPVN